MPTGARRALPGTDPGHGPGDDLYSHTRIAVTVLSWTLAAIAMAVQFRVSSHHLHVGLDFRPLYQAGRAAIQGRSIYAVPAFVYPPPAALLGAALNPLPLRLLVPSYVLAEILVLVAIATVTITWLVPRNWWAPASGVASAALVWSNPAARSLWLDNISVLLAGVALVIVWLFGRDHWLTGCLVLALSLLIKPLLLPLALIPILVRRPRPLLISSGAGIALLLAALPLTSGFGRIPDVVSKLLHGSVLIGSRAAANLSLRGFAEAHHLPGAVSLTARLLVAAMAAWMCWTVIRRPRAVDVPWVACLASTLLLSLLLAGSLSEVHYLFAVLPGGFAVFTVTRTRWAWAASAVGAAAVLFPIHRGTPIFHQDVLVLAEIAFFVAGVLALGTQSPAPATPTGEARTHVDQINVDQINVDRTSSEAVAR